MFTVIVFFIILISCGLSLVNRLNLELNPGRSTSSLSVRFFWAWTETRVIEQESISKFFYLKFLLANLYDETLQKENVITVAKELLGKDVKIEATVFEEIKEEIRKIISQKIKRETKPNLNMNGKFKLQHW